MGSLLKVTKSQTKNILIYETMPTHISKQLSLYQSQSSWMDSLWWTGDLSRVYPCLSPEESWDRLQQIPVCHGVGGAWQPFFVFLLVLWVLFCALCSPVFCLPCFLFYFEGLSCPRGVYLHFPSVHLPNCLHLSLVCKSCLSLSVCHLVCLFSPVSLPGLFSCSCLAAPSPFGGSY